MDVSRIPNGAIFEGTKGSIVADFTTRMILPNNDDGDLTYYKRRDKGALLPLIGGTGQVTQGRRPAAQRQARKPWPPGFTAMPSAEPGPNGFAVVQFVDGKVPAAWGFRIPPSSRYVKPRRADNPPPATCFNVSGSTRAKEEQQRRARHEQQNALRLRLRGIDDGADAVGSCRASCRQEARVRRRDWPRNQFGRRRTSI